MVFDQDGYKLGLEYHTGGKDFRILSDEDSRGGLYSAATNVLARAIDLLPLPHSLQFGLKAISFSNGDEPGSKIIAESFEKKIRLILPKIPRKEIYKNGEIDVDNPLNIFNDAVKELKGEIEFYIHGQRQQLAFDFEKDQEAENEKSREVADRITNFPKAKSAAQ
jgi:hypothetical protein